MWTTPRLTSLLVAGALALSACGGDTETATPAAAGDDGGGNEATGVTIEAGEFFFDPEDFSLPADQDVELTLDNIGVVEHDIVVEELDDRELIYTEGSTTVTETVNLPEGTYTYYCSVPGHRQGGMEGTLTVE